MHAARSQHTALPSPFISVVGCDSDVPESFWNGALEYEDQVESDHRRRLLSRTGPADSGPGGGGLQEES